MDEVITFDKSLQQRLQEYSDVLSGYEVLPVSAIQKEWSFYLELTLDPNGWQAVWKIPRKTCETLGIPFPTIVLTLVLSLDLANLKAYVRILAVQDDIQLPEKHHVHLKHLYATKEQDKTVALNIDCTANALDMLRFFYLNLLMPWDFEDDSTTDWRSKHLESRLRLFYDVKTGIIPRITAEHLHSLLSEARRLQARKDELENDLSEADDNPMDEENNQKIDALMEMHIRMMEIKNEIDVLENPLLRRVIIRRHTERTPVLDDGENNVWVVYSHGLVEEYVQFLDKVRQEFPNEIVRYMSDLTQTLERGKPNDVYILSEWTHEVHSIGALEAGGVLKGMSDKDKTVLTSSAEDVMLDFRAESVLLENITINATTSQYAIVVRQGKLTMKNCKIVGDGKSSTQQGIIILSGGNLELVDCEISDFCTGIVANSGSNLTINSTLIHNVNFGVKTYDRCAINMVKATVRDCRDYGICIETQEVTQANSKQGGFEILKIIPKIQLELVEGENNTKGDVLISNKSKLKPIEDLFKNPDWDWTICESSTEEMEMEHREEGRVSPATV